MVGGYVYSILELDDVVSVTVEDEGQLLTVDLEPCDDSRNIKMDDSLWWQGKEAYWTPKDRSFKDRAIKRIGYSYQLPMG